MAGFVLHWDGDLLHIKEGPDRDHLPRQPADLLAMQPSEREHETAHVSPRTLVLAKPSIVKLNAQKHASIALYC